MAPVASVVGGVRGRVFFPGLCQNQSRHPPSQTQLRSQGLGGEAWAPAMPPLVVATHLAPLPPAAGPLPPDQGD